MVKWGPPLAGAAALLLAATAHAEPGRDNYILHCMGCHLDDGRETPGIVPALIDTGRFLTIAGGREFLVQVPGVSGSTLDDASLANLMNWMLYEFSPESIPADFEPYTPAEVAAYRVEPLADVDSVRADLLAEISRNKKAVP